LADEEGFVGRTIQERQDPPSGLAKEEIPDGRERCSHSENNCTQIEYNWPAEGIYPDIIV